MTRRRAQRIPVRLPPLHWRQIPGKLATEEPVELRPTPSMLAWSDKYRALAYVGDSWTKEGPKRWSERNARLAGQAEGGDDEALFELLTRDPRVAQSAFVAIKILMWQFLQLAGRAHPGAPPEAKRAGQKLARLGQAIRHRRWGGRIYDPFQLALAADRALEQVEIALAGIHDPLRRHRPHPLSAIAQASGLTVPQVAALRANPRARARVAYEVAASKIGLSYERFRKLLPRRRPRRS
jgi:hypothetical protein